MANMYSKQCSFLAWKYNRSISVVVYGVYSCLSLSIQHILLLNSCKICQNSKCQNVSKLVNIAASGLDDLVTFDGFGVCLINNKGGPSVYLWKDRHWLTHIWVACSLALLPTTSIPGCKIIECL